MRSLLTLLLLSCTPTPPLPPPPPRAAPTPAVRAGALELDGVPPVPADLKDALAPYLNVRSASLADMAPDGSALLIRTRLGGDTAQLHLVTQPLGARQQLTFLDEPVSAGGLVPGGSGDVMFRSDTGGTEAYQLYRLDRQTGRVDRLTDGRSRHGGYLWDHRGERYVYTANARNGRDLDLYLSSAPDAPLFEAEGSWSALAFSPDDQRLLVRHYVSVNDARLHLLDLASARLTRLSPAEAPASDRDGLFSADGETLYVTSDREGEFVSLYAVDLASQRWTRLTEGIPWNVEQLTLSPDGGTLAFTVNADGVSAMHLLDTATGVTTAVQGAPPGRVQGLRFAEAAPVLGFALESGSAVADVWTHDLREGTFTQWTRSEVGGMDPDAFVAPELVRFASFDGLEVPAFYYRPPGPGPHPVLVRIHGGPEAQARLNFSATTQHLVRDLGIAVLVPNVRGSNGYGKSYLLLDNGMKREDSVRDIGALLDWIAARPELDAERVAVSGGSYGGYMVLAALTTYPDRIRAGVDVVGISNFVTFLEGTKAYRRDLRRAEYGDERDPEMRAFLERISPVNSADRIQSALFVAHGANDPRVPVGEARQIVEAVRANGQDVWLLVAHDEGHGFRKQANREVYTQLWVMFLARHLLTGPDGE